MSHTSESQIPALGPFARRLRRYWLGIVNRVRWPMHTGELEGINNKIKVIKRMACGYRDSEYIFLKIQAAIPVIREEPKKGAVSGAFGKTGGVDGTRTRDLRRDRPAF